MVSRLALLTALLLVPAGSTALAATRPSVALSSVTVKRVPAKPSSTTVMDVRFRLCVSVGPKALFLVDEVLKVGGVTKAKNHWTDPLGVDLTKPQPFGCASRYQISWVVKPRLARGPGTYTATIRVRDAHGTVSRPMSFSYQPGG